MEPIKTFEGLLEQFRGLERKRNVAVVCPDDEHTAEVVGRCLDDNLAYITLVTVNGRVMPDELAVRKDRFKAVYDCADPDEAAACAVRLVRDGEADVIMKGNINTDNLLRAVLHDGGGLLPKGRVMSHITLLSTPAYHKLLMFSDAAVIPRPDFEKFDAMVRYDTEAARRLGIAKPKVALIHFTEKTNPKFQHTLDYTEIKRLAAEGAYGPIAIGGPMDVKTACDPHSGAVKGIKSDINGDADILIFPNLEAANTFYKTMSLFGGARMAGVISGTMAPVVVPSRADSSESKFYSLALACVLS